MKPAPFSYYRAKSMDDAIETVAKFDGYAKYLAGGQTLGPMMNLRLAQPELVVDISNLPDLHAASLEADHLVLGAGIRHSMIEDNLVPDVSGGLMSRAAAGIAYRAIRNRGTIGGSLAHADPSAEWPTVLYALDAKIVTKSGAGHREITINDFFVGALTTLLRDDEVIQNIKIAKFPKGLRWGFEKSSRKAGEFAHSLAIAIVDPAGHRSGVTLGAISETPVRLAATSNLLAENKHSAPSKTSVFSAVREDIVSSGIELDDYEMQIHSRAVNKAIEQLFR